MQFYQSEPAYVKFDYNIPRGASIGVYARRNALPTHTQYHFKEVLSGFNARTTRSTHVSSFFCFHFCFCFRFAFCLLHSNGFLVYVLMVFDSFLFLFLIFSNRRWAEKWHDTWSRAIGLSHCTMTMVTNRRLHFMQLLPMTWHKTVQMDAQAMANACWVIANAIRALVAMTAAKVSS